MTLTRWAGAVVFLAGCSVWAWAPHVHGVGAHAVSGALGAIGALLYLWPKTWKPRR